MTKLLLSSLALIGMLAVVGCSSDSDSSSDMTQEERYAAIDEEAQTLNHCETVDDCTGVQMGCSELWINKYENREFLEQLTSELDAPYPEGWRCPLSCAPEVVRCESQRCVIAPVSSEYEATNDEIMVCGSGI
ncbi:MAG: hypothetical protein IPJ88_17820 [Myxococcales bacterium]|nr:MAG: hypothetical protein IPJ88_17820 [Myxococcales bacterium]